MLAEVKPLRSAVHRKRTRPTICSQPKDVSIALNLLFFLCVFYVVSFLVFSYMYC